MVRGTASCDSLVIARLTAGALGVASGTADVLRRLEYVFGDAIDTVVGAGIAAHALRARHAE
jgi:hypothetical protein